MLSICNKQKKFFIIIVYNHKLPRIFCNLRKQKCRAAVLYDKLTKIYKYSIINLFLNPPSCLFMLSMFQPHLLFGPKSPLTAKCKHTLTLILDNEPRLKCVLTYTVRTGAFDSAMEPHCCQVSPRFPGHF